LAPSGAVEGGVYTRRKRKCKGGNGFPPPPAWLIELWSQPQRRPVTTPSALMSTFSRVATKSIVTCVVGVMCRTVALAGGTAGSVAGFPTIAAYCAMLQVSAAGSVGAGAGVSTGGVVVVVVSVVVVDVAGSDGVHAISASPASIIRGACFMA
jgi:hypothetical protein